MFCVKHVCSIPNSVEILCLLFPENDLSRQMPWCLDHLIRELSFLVASPYLSSSITFFYIVDCVLIVNLINRLIIRMTDQTQIALCLELTFTSRKKKIHNHHHTTETYSCGSRLQKCMLDLITFDV